MISLYIIVGLFYLSSLIIFCVSYMISFKGKNSTNSFPFSFGLGVDIVLMILNLGTKLIRWMSSIDYNCVGVCSLAVYQCGDGVEVFF